MYTSSFYYGQWSVILLAVIDIQQNQLRRQLLTRVADYMTRSVEGQLCVYPFSSSRY